MWQSVSGVAVGAALGALLRWWLGGRLNPLAPILPLGTLAANLIGGYVVGLALAIFAARPELSDGWRLFVITGFCGGLTTFSSFSAEVVHLLQAGRQLTAVAAIALHVGGSLVAPLAGIATVGALRSR
ncbi:MAG TPA: fluoride efflux transporter CrcB [Rhodocyclaceae bacterium]|nr:fluoride efflux transporter CrcB [Rhodocyclaceae bacterium]